MASRPTPDQLMASLARTEILADVRAVIGDYLANQPGPAWASLRDVLRSWRQQGIGAGTEWESVVNYLLTYCPPRGVRQGFRNKALTQRLSPELSKKIIALTNRTRGRVYETSFGISTVTKIMEDPTSPQDVTYHYNTLTLTHPSLSGASRRYDIVAEKGGKKYAFEIKSGRCSACKFVREQVKKDKILLENGLVHRCSWLLYRGATKAMLKLLHDAGISYFDFVLDVEDSSWLDRLLSHDASYSSPA